MSDQPKSILIVEDSPTQAERLKQILEQEHYRVSAAKNGEEALEMLPTIRPNLVITDIMMPKMNGYQLCTKVKSHPDFKYTPVILLTSLADVTDVIKGLESNADHFITKPYEEKYLLSRVEYVLSNIRLDMSEKPQGQIEVDVSGIKYFIKASRSQILNLLLSTFEAAVQRNHELSDTKGVLQSTNDELEEKNLKLKLVNEELEKFSYSISHDLRGPLRVINGFSTAFMEEYGATLQDKGKDYLNRITHAVEQMGTLIDGLLDLSQINRKPIIKTTVNLSKIVHEILDNLTKLEPNRKVKLSIQEGVTAEGDPQLLRAVFENLLQNAWKFTSKTAEPSISFGAQSQKNETLFFVRDNGVGFNMKFASKLFSPFQRLHPASEFEGTGIGLATVQRIIHRHSGTIWVESEIGKGTTFFFKI